MEEENDTTKAIKQAEKEFKEYKDKLTSIRPSTKIRKDLTKNIDSSIKSIENAKKEYIKSLKAWDLEADLLEKNPQADPTKYEKATAAYYEAKEQFEASKANGDVLIEDFKMKVGGSVDLFATTEKARGQGISSPTATPKTPNGGQGRGGGMNHSW